MKSPQERYVLVFHAYGRFWYFKDGKRPRFVDKPSGATHYLTRGEASDVWRDVAREKKIKGWNVEPVALSVHMKQRKSHGAVRSNPHKAGTADKAAARELLLFIENDGELYRMQASQIQKNLSKKFKTGKYSSTKAAKLWTYLANNGAKKYAFEHGSQSGTARGWYRQKGYGFFTAATRRLVGRLLEKSWHAEMKAGNFHD